MQTHPDLHPNLSNVLAPHLDALSAASASFFTPLTSVLTALISEIVALRAAQDQLQARLSRIDAQPPISSPSIPSPPISLSPKSPIIDPELTQPPSPLPPWIPNQKHASSNFQYETRQQRAEENPPVQLMSSSVGSGINSDRLKRRRRSSKRPSSGSDSPLAKQERCEQPTEVISSQEIPACPTAQRSLSNPPTVRAPSQGRSPGLESSDKECDTPKKICEIKRKPLKECDQNLLVLPTTPTTEMKRKSDVLPYEPIIRGFRNAAAAARTVEKIVSRREAEQCPPAFRLQQRSLSERTCLQCQDFLRAQAAQAANPDVAFQRLLRSGCSHKEELPRPCTPDGYWALDFAETPTQPP